MASLPLDEIRVGTRHRKDMGDVAGLAASMAQLGLLHPIVVDANGMLVAGERRLQAAKLLGWPDIPITVVDLDQLVRGEFAENTFRKAFTPSEAVAIARALEPLERAAAKERQREGGRLGRGKVGASLPTPDKGRARDKAARVTGVARRTLEKAAAIVDAAELEPARFGKLLTDMDRTGRVNGVFRRLKIAVQAEQIRAEPPPLPGNGPYRVIVADVPWPYEARDEDPSRRGVRPYPTMSIEQICALEVAPVTHGDSILFLWVPNSQLVQGLHLPILRAWGDFEPKTLITWNKPRFGNGDWLRSQTEQCVMAVRGAPVVTLTNQSTRLDAPMRGHSVKPPEFYDLVESLCPAPRYADLFSRYRHDEKWDCHGDQAPPSAAAAADLDDIPDFLLRSKRAPTI